MDSKTVRKAMSRLLDKDCTIYNNKRKTLRMIKLVWVNPKKVEKIVKKFTALGATKVEVKRIRGRSIRGEYTVYSLNVLAHFPLECK